MRKPGKLRVLIQNGDTGFFCDHELEDLTQQLERISLHLKHLTTLSIEV